MSCPPLGGLLVGPEAGGGVGGRVALHEELAPTRRSALLHHAVLRRARAHRVPRHRQPRNRILGAAVTAAAPAAATAAADAALLHISTQHTVSKTRHLWSNLKGRTPHLMVDSMFKFF